MWYVAFLLIFFFPFLASAEDELLTHLKLKSYLKSMDEIQVATPLKKCGDELQPKCPVVHVSKWCEKQYELLEKAPLKGPPSFTKENKTLLFLAEEHGDEAAYNYYEKLLSNEKFDCLFLELPNVFQKNFDSKKGIIQDNGTFENLSRKKEESLIQKITLKDLGYLSLLDSLVAKAQEKEIKIILVDSSDKKVLHKELKDSLKERNEAMADNIQKAFDKKSCSHGLSIQGTQHLFSENKETMVKPVDQILKDKKGQDIAIKKAMLYSAVSENFKEAMGPCSWVNKLPENEEIYYDRSSFADQAIFPEEIEKSMKDIMQVSPTRDADFLVMLPLNLEENFFLKRVNQNKKAPKKYKEKKEFKKMASDIPLSLKTNISTLGISWGGEESLWHQCFSFCSEKELKSEYLVSKITPLSPTIECQSYHPSRTGGALYAPEYLANYEISIDCYCLK